jgi:LysM repeat protein
VTKPRTSASKPVAKTTTSKPKPKPATKKSSGGIHVVVPGDSLWAIARKNDTTVAKLKAANGLTSDKLKLGLKLKLP